MPNYRWKQILEMYPNQQDAIDLYNSKQIKELKELWNCSVDCVRTVRDKLGLQKKNISQVELIQKYTKEQLEDLYFNKYDRHLKEMAEGLNVYQDTLSQVFETLGIIQQPHHPSEYDEVRKVIGEKNKIHAQEKNYLEHITNTPNWREKSDASRRERGSAKRLKSKYRWLESVETNDLIEWVNLINISEVAAAIDVPHYVLRGYLERVGWIQEEWKFDKPSWILGRTKETDVRVLELSKKISKTRKQMVKDGILDMQVLNLKAQENNPSKIEVLVNGELVKRNLGFDWNTQISHFQIDFVNEQFKIIIETDGCYYHACPRCRPDSVIGKASIGRNKGKNAYLAKMGYKVFRVWEHDLVRKNGVTEFINTIEAYINEQKTKI